MKRFLVTFLLLASFAAIHAEDIAIVVAKDCKLEELDLAALRTIMMGMGRLSPTKSKWTVALRPKTSVEHQAMLKYVFKMTPIALETYLRLGEFNGSIDPTPKVVPSSDLLLRIVSGNHSAIGYLRISAVTDSVKILKIEGTLPGDSKYPIKSDE